jgi:hypothetical protein
MMPVFGRALPIFGHLRDALTIRSSAAEAPTDRLQLGAHARQLLDDPVLALAFDKLADDLAQTWRSSQVGDREAREEAYRMVWAIEGARSKLSAMLGDAKLIEAEHARKEQEQARRQERGLT